MRQQRYSSLAVILLVSASVYLCCRKWRVQVDTSLVVPLHVSIGDPSLSVLLQVAGQIGRLTSYFVASDASNLTRRVKLYASLAVILLVTRPIGRAHSCDCCKFCGKWDASFSVR